MNIYVVLGGEKHQGYNQPLGLFSSKTKAVKAAKLIIEKEKWYDFVVVIEYAVDSKKEPEQVYPKIKPMTKKRHELYLKNWAPFMAATLPQNIMRDLLSDDSRIEI